MLESVIFKFKESLCATKVIFVKKNFIQEFITLLTKF